MFSHVQFTTRVISGFAVRYPITFSVNHAAIFVWIFSRDSHDFLHSHTRSCLSQQPLSHRSALTTSWDVATRPLSVFSLRRRFRRCYLKALAYTAAQIVTSPHLRFWHDSLLPDGRHHHWLSTLPPGDSLSRQSHRRSQHRPHPHHRPSCILRAPHPSETHACRLPTLSSRSLPPSALQPRLHGASHHLQRLRASSPRRAPLHAAHVSIQLRIIACSWAPFSPLPAYRPRPTLVSISRDSRTFPRTFNRQRYKDSWTHWTLHSYFIYASFISAFHVSIICVFILQCSYISFLSIYLVFSTFTF